MFTKIEVFLTKKIFYYFLIFNLVGCEEQIEKKSNYYTYNKKTGTLIINLTKSPSIRYVNLFGANDFESQEIQFIVFDTLISSISTYKKIKNINKFKNTKIGIDEEGVVDLNKSNIYDLYFFNEKGVYYCEVFYYPDLTGNIKKYIVLGDFDEDFYCQKKRIFEINENKFKFELKNLKVGKNIVRFKLLTVEYDEKKQKIRDSKIYVTRNIQLK